MMTTPSDARQSQRAAPAQGGSDTDRQRPPGRKRVRGLVIIAALGLLATSLIAALTEHPELAARRPALSFSVPRLSDADQSLQSADLVGAVSLLNVWATWCVPCRKEHSTLLAIARETDVPVFGLNYKDDRQDALRWLERLGNPYRDVGSDPQGHVSERLGVAGAPETFVLDPQGRVVYRHVGALTIDDWRTTLAPLVERLRSRRS